MKFVGYPSIVYVFHNLDSFPIFGLVEKGASWLPRASLIFLSVFLITLTPISIVHAHQPIFNNKEVMSRAAPYEIKKPEISKALYSTLNGVEHYYKISSEKPFNFYVGINVPKIDECINFPKFSFSILDQDFKVIQVFDGEEFLWWTWYEPYGKKWYWVGPEYGENFKSMNVFKAGTYYIKVFNKNNRGNYALAVGDIEKFNLLVIAKTIVTVLRINKKFWNKSNCG